MHTTYITSGSRTPIGNIGGGLSSVRPDDMLALVIRNLLSKNDQLDPAAIADVIVGCANQSGEDNRNVARMALLLAGMPHSVPGETVNRLCASGLSSIMNAARAIACGDGNVMIAGGVENMTRSPWVLSKSGTPFGRDAQLFDTTFGWRFVNPKFKEKFGTDSMGETAENLVDIHHVSREDQDRFSLWSHQKAAKSQALGRLNKEIVSVSIPQKKGESILFEKDEFIKPNTSLDILTKLKPSFRKEGTITAGNASGLNDGAAAVLLANESGIKDFNLKPIARIVSMSVVGVEPRIMGIGPVKAIEIALKKAKLTLPQIDIIELNEAFAAQSLAVTRSLGLADDDSRINPNGGAISLGHPLGMSGTRIAYSAAIELQEKNLKYALVTMCVGVGQGYAVILEKA